MRPTWSPSFPGISFAGIPLMALLVALGTPSTLLSQTQPHPITSLPKAPGDTSAATPSAYAPAAESTGDVRPITSLPKPPDAAPAAMATAASAPPPSSLAAPTPDAAPAYVAPPTPAASAPVAISSSSAPPAPAPMPTVAAYAQPTPPPAPKPGPKPVRPFSTVAVGVKFGIGGIGGEVAVPLAQHFNLRAGGSFFSYSGNFNTDGTNIDGDLKFRSATINLDWFPFKGGFRISPGVTVYNGNNLNATASVPGGSTFTLNNIDYISSPSDPVGGTASFTFGSRQAFNLTMGFGNMIPRSGKHVSFPFEIGVEFLAQQPLIALNLTGTACQGNTLLINCQKIASDPTTQANLAAEVNEINTDIKPLRFYPIISQGLAVRF